MTGQLPGFQGNVPIGLKSIIQDSNMTDNNKGTAWMDALDPTYATITDEWMQTMVHDFGTDHWWQLDGYFNGGTAPWLMESTESEVVSDSKDVSFESKDLPDLPDWYARGVQAYTGVSFHLSIMYIDFCY